MHTYIICIGSNYHCAENVAMAREKLSALFPGIRYAEEEETQPLLFSSSSTFLNQVATFQSYEAPLAVHAHLKQIEQTAGRIPEHKKLGLVLLDLDLLMCDTVILKPADMDREYIIRGIERLKLKPIIP